MIKGSCLALILFQTASLLGSDIQTISKSKGVLSQTDLNDFKHEFKLCSFIETGTYIGDTTAVASEVFDQVYTVDIYEPIYNNAKIRFAQKSNVHLYLGDTCDMLQGIIKDSLSRRLYWLDAHSSGGGTGGVPGFSPILSELKQIFECEDDDFVILIDDLRGMCHCDSRTNLPLREIISCINEEDSNLRFYSIGDIGIIYNTKNYPSVVASDLVEAASISRFFDPNDKNERALNRLIDAEFFISNVENYLEESENFLKLFGFVNRNELGGEVIYLLWESLHALGEGDYESASKGLELVSKSFYSHWRIDAYHVKALILNGQLDEARSLFEDKLLGIQKSHPKILEKIFEDKFEVLNGASLWTVLLN